MPNETTDQQNARIVTQLNALRCPTCQSPLIFGGWESVYRYVDLTKIEPTGWQDGKCNSDGHTLECAVNSAHNVDNVLPDNMQEIQDFLNEL